MALALPCAALQSLLLAVSFEWAVALYGLDAAYKRTANPEQRATATAASVAKVRRQFLKDYLVFPALAGRRWRQVLGAVMTANIVRNLWTYAVIVCGHFADGAEKFTADGIERETRSEWYLRQMLGTANITAGSVPGVEQRHPLLDQCFSRHVPVLLH